MENPMSESRTQIHCLKSRSRELRHSRAGISLHSHTMHSKEQDGEAKALAQFTATRFERVIDKFRWVIGLVANPFVRPALRLPFLGYEQGGL
jgi:hypothetical protein